MDTAFLVYKPVPDGSSFQNYQESVTFANFQQKCNVSPPPQYDHPLFSRGIWQDVRILEQSFPRCKQTKHCLPETVKPQLTVCEAGTINIKCSPCDPTLRTLFLPGHFPVYLLMNLNTSYFSLNHISAGFRAYATFHQWANSWASGPGGGVPCLLWEIILT